MRAFARGWEEGFSLRLAVELELADPGSGALDDDPQLGVAVFHIRERQFLEARRHHGGEPHAVLLKGHAEQAVIDHRQEARGAP